MIRVMSLAISSLSLLPAFFNLLRSCLNNLISTTSVFNPAPITAINLAASAVKTPQLPWRIYPKGLHFTLVLLLHAWCLLILVFGGMRSWDGIWGPQPPEHSPVCVAQHRLPKHYTAISELMEKLKTGKTEMLLRLHSSATTAMRIEKLLCSDLKNTNLLIARAWQECSLRLLRWFQVISGWWHFQI